MKNDIKNDTESDMKVNMKNKQKGKLKVAVYGDSIMRGTVPDENMRYHFRFNDFAADFQTLPIEIVNRSKFGATSYRGERILKRDVAAGCDYDLALLEYGGNDCNHNWDEVAVHPEQEHLPKVALPGFVATVEKMADLLIQKGVKPVLMNLPPIDAEKYLNFMRQQGLNVENILAWLGDVSMIYRFHEMYSNAVEKLAARKNLLLVDVRSAFLRNHSFKQLISADGMHPSREGYRVIFDELFKNARSFACFGAV